MTKYLFFWGHTPRRPGHIDASCLSQWWASEFRADGHRFGTAEQYMMWRKARLFDADGAAAAILAAEGPGQAKALGRTVPGFDERRWREHRLDIVVAGNRAKFEADARARDFLVGTGDRVLAEASPLDRVWGIGLARDHPDATDPDRWRGENLLGIALMRVRDELR